jgi:hypothetical protein
MNCDNSLNNNYCRVRLAHYFLPQSRGPEDPKLRVGTAERLTAKRAKKPQSAQGKTIHFRIELAHFLLPQIHRLTAKCAKKRPRTQGITIHFQIDTFSNFQIELAHCLTTSHVAFF